MKPGRLRERAGNIGVEEGDRLKLAQKPKENKLEIGRLRKTRSGARRRPSPEEGSTEFPEGKENIWRYNRTIPLFFLRNKTAYCGTTTVIILQRYSTPTTYQK